MLSISQAKPVTSFFRKSASINLKITLIKVSLNISVCRKREIIQY